MTLGLTTPDGFSTMLDFGFANARQRRPRSPPTPCSRSARSAKSMVAALIHQVAAEGRLHLTDRISDLLPAIAAPAAAMASPIQHLLDHVAGLPDDAPLSPQGGLWTGLRAGRALVIIPTPATRSSASSSSISAASRSRSFSRSGSSPRSACAQPRARSSAPTGPAYAQGYEAADPTVPFARGVPLAPAAWVDVTFGAGCVASTADDMTRLPALARRCGARPRRRSDLATRASAARSRLMPYRATRRE